MHWTKDALSKKHLSFRPDEYSNHVGFILEYQSICSNHFFPLVYTAENTSRQLHEVSEFFFFFFYSGCGTVVPSFPIHSYCHPYYAILLVIHPLAVLDKIWNHKMEGHCSAFKLHLWKKDRHKTRRRCDKMRTFSSSLHRLHRFHHIPSLIIQWLCLQEYTLVHII